MFRQYLFQRAVSFFYKFSLLVSIINFNKRQTFGEVWKVKKETGLALSLTEAAQLYNAVRDTVKVPGDIAEVGVYRGGSAKLICEAKGHKKLHLFDTFEGLPDLSVWMIRECSIRTSIKFH